MTKQRLIQLIHIARSDLQDTPQLNRVLESMKKKGFRIKPAGKATSGLPLDSHPQSKKIRALWLEMAAAGVVRDSSEQALALWVKRETGISALRWLSNEQASSVIEKLKKWQRRAAGVKQ